VPPGHRGRDRRRRRAGRGGLSRALRSCAGPLGRVSRRRSGVGCLGTRRPGTDVPPGSREPATAGVCRGSCEPGTAGLCPGSCKPGTAGVRPGSRERGTAGLLLGLCGTRGGSGITGWNGSSGLLPGRYAVCGFGSGGYRTCGSGDRSSRSGVSGFRGCGSAGPGSGACRGRGGRAGKDRPGRGGRAFGLVGDVAWADGAVRGRGCVRAAGGLLRFLRTRLGGVRLGLCRAWGWGWEASGALGCRGWRRAPPGGLRACLSWLGFVHSRGPRVTGFRAGCQGGRRRRGRAVVWGGMEAWPPAAGRWDRAAGARLGGSRRPRDVDPRRHGAQGGGLAGLERRSALFAPVGARCGGAIHDGSGALRGGVDGAGRHAAAAPHPADHRDLVRFADRGQPGPGAGLGQIAHLGDQQLREPLALDDRARAQPRQDARRNDVDDVPRRVKRHLQQLEQDDPGHKDANENTDLHQRQGHRQPKIIKLVEPLLDAPDIGVRGQIHAAPTP
jgi:hypothetical protein